MKLVSAGEGLEADDDAAAFGLGHGRAEGFKRPLPGQFGRDAWQDIALFGRADHHAGAAQVGAEIHQVAKVAGRALANQRVGVVEVKPLRLEQHPMNAGDGDLAACGSLAHPAPLPGEDVGHRRPQRERGDLQSVVAQPGGGGQGVVEFPALEDFVADGEFHAANSCPWGPLAQGGNGGGNDE